MVAAVVDKMNEEKQREIENLTRRVESMESEFGERSTATLDMRFSNIFRAKRDIFRLSTGKNGLRTSNCVRKLTSGTTSKNVKSWRCRYGDEHKRYI